ncbi:MAG: LptF/LptG family permease, partial [Candidatus Omnitrophica bacterium]|nr:LptF/LptG family permease [Candidatus Omnitrophota bacterium]
FSFSIITFILLGFGVSLAVKHREKSINFGIALLAAGIYYLLFILGQTLVENHILTPFIGMWIPNIVIASVGGYFIFKNAHR